MRRNIIVTRRYDNAEAQDLVDYDTGKVLEPIDMIGWVCSGGVQNVNGKWVLEFKEPDPVSDGKGSKLLPYISEPPIEGETLSEYRSRQKLPGAEAGLAKTLRWTGGAWHREIPSS